MARVQQLSDAEIDEDCKRWHSTTAPVAAIGSLLVDGNHIGQRFGLVDGLLAATLVPFEAQCSIRASAHRAT